jgi:hypothetical protein
LSTHKLYETTNIIEIHIASQTATGQNSTSGIENATGTGGYFTKEKDKRYFNTTRFALTGRIGWGNISAFGTYTITDFFKEGQGPVVRPFSVGLAISGL